jgi:cytoskeletal protein CcmA (bactofilin family)
MSTVGTTHPSVPRTRRPAAALRATVVAVVLGLVGMVATAPAARAATLCTGTLSGTTVRGDVRAEGACTLNGVQVLGALDVATGAAVVGADVTVAGDVRVAQGASLDLTGARLAGGVRLVDAGTVRVSGTVAASVRGSSRVVALTGRVGGAVNVTVPDRHSSPFGVFLTDVTVGGWVNLVNGRAGIHGSVLRRGLTMTSSRGALMCESQVRLDTVIQRSRGLVQVDDPSRTGPQRGGCTDERWYVRGVLHGDVLVADNVAVVVLGLTDVLGDLECRGNSAGVGLAAARVTGTVTGCA